MKAYIKSLAFLFVGLIFFNCSNEKTQDKHEEVNIDLSNMKMDLNKLNLNEPQILFSYKDRTELIQQSDLKIKELLKEIEEIVDSNEKITNVLFDIRFDKGFAHLDNVYFLDAINREVINISDESNALRFPNFDWDGLINGAACPNGYTNNGSCTNAQCISDTTQELLTGEGGINSSGDCVEIRYNRGLLGVRICSRGC